ncbi:MAG TPA: TlpA disulfide reductase family protein [Balneolaceae bacterium]|nr:TlpA disulfide reductase family protein [Balneolaceae bacterium]
MQFVYSHFKALIFFSLMLFAAVDAQQAKPLYAGKTDTLLKDVSPAELQEVIQSYKGKKAVLINVWATWCVPCVEEFPEIVKLQRAYPDQLQVIFISADFPDSRSRALKFLKEHDVDWTTYFKTGKDQPFIEAISKDWSGALPFSRIIDKKGTVVESWEQKAGYEKFERYVKKQ